MSINEIRQCHGKAKKRAAMTAAPNQKRRTKHKRNKKYYLLLWFRLTDDARPIRPVPRRKSVAGSGTPTGFQRGDTAWIFS
jgi:hypothetical protein